MHDYSPDIRATMVPGFCHRDMRRKLPDSMLRGTIFKKKDADMCGTISSKNTLMFYWILHTIIKGFSPSCFFPAVSATVFFASVFCAFHGMPEKYRYTPGCFPLSAHPGKQPAKKRDSFTDTLPGSAPVWAVRPETGDGFPHNTHGHDRSWSDAPVVLLRQNLHR